MDTLTTFFNGIPFFQSALYGIIAMIIVGSSWCLIGLVMGDAPKKGIEPSLVQLFGYLVSGSISLTLILTTGTYSTAPMDVTLWTCAAYAFSGLSNFIMLQIMSHAMQSGPNGIIWAIIQSALIFPFIGGVLFFDVNGTPLRWCGIVSLLVALGLFACCKNNSSKGGSKWLLESFICLAICAVQQNITTMPSYFESARGVPSIVRALASVVGGIVTALIYNLVLMNANRWQQIKSSLRNATLWKYIGALQFFSLIFAYTLFYPGMNVMADHGMGGMCYPVMVGSCIVSFTLSSIFILHERFQKVQIFALTACLTGILLLCLFPDQSQEKKTDQPAAVQPAELPAPPEAAPAGN